MHQNTVLAIALVLLLASFPLISLGTEQELGAVWALGLAFIVVGGLIPPVIRFVGTGEPEPDGQGDDDGDGARDRTTYVNYGIGEADSGSGVLPTGRPPDRQPERVTVQRERAKQVGEETEGEDEDRDAADAARPERG